MISKSAAPALRGGMFHWPVIFIVAVQNETLGSGRLRQSLCGGENQYGNIRARLIRASLLPRGHRGATAFKRGNSIVKASLGRAAPAI